MARLATTLLLTGIALLVGTAPAASAKPLRLERAVVLMRHGVRPPTNNPPLPAGIASQPWPAWPVAAGYLTPHGATAIRLLGGWDRQWLAKAGLMPMTGCPTHGMIRVRSDSDQRTIASGDAYLEGLAAGCAIANEHRPQDDADALFRAGGENGAPFDPRRADAAVRDALGAGGIEAAERGQDRGLARVNSILCGPARTSCGVSRNASGVTPASAAKRPKLTGALDRGSTAAQIFLLQYAEGKPMREVGWGRVTAADVATLGALHSTEFALLARPPYLAAANAGPLAETLLAALDDTVAGAPRLVALVGHDTNVASMAGLMGYHWRIPGFATDDPPPGGAIMFELLRDGAGRRFVRASFRAQSLEALRRLSPPSRAGSMVRQPLVTAGCAALCPLGRFRQIVRAKLDAAR